MENNPDQKLSWTKALLMTIGIIIVALGLLYLGTLIGLDDLWIAFLALVIWGAIGMKMEQAPGVFIGGAVGLCLSLSVEILPDLYGEWAAVIGIAGIIFAIASSIKGAFPLFFNFSTFAFMTVGGADVILDERLQLSYLPNLAFGAVIFWIVPWVFLKFRPAKEK